MATVSSRPSLADARRPLALVLSVAQVLLACMFLMAGGHKLAGNARMVGLFDTLGLGQWFRYLTGALEIVGGVLLLLPAAAGLGAVLLALLMVAAVAAHLLVLHDSPTLPVALLLALGVVGWARWTSKPSLQGRDEAS